jgi:hypothetical protein
MDFGKNTFGQTLRHHFFEKAEGEKELKDKAGKPY